MENTFEDVFKMKSTKIGTFIGQSKTKLVLGRARYKVRNRDIGTADLPDYLRYPSVYDEDRELTPLEELYKKFCQDACRIIIGDSSMQGGNHPSRIIIPDFTYDIIPERFPVE